MRTHQRISRFVLAQCLQTSVDELHLDQSHLSFEELPEWLDTYRTERNLQHRTWSLPETLIQGSEAWQQQLCLVYQHEVAFPASVAPEQGQWLHNILLDLKPKHIVEVGCFIGASSIWMASALQTIGTGKIHSVDLFLPKYPVPPFHYGFLGNPLEFAQASIKNAGLASYVSFYAMPSHTFCKQIHEPIDFIFIDGDHTIGGCLNDFISYYPYLQEGGYILLHDIYPEHCGCDGPRYLLDHYLNNSSHFEVTEIATQPVNFGMALIKKLKTHKGYYPWRHFPTEILRQPSRIKANIRFSQIFQQHLEPRVKAWLAKRNMLQKT